MVANARQAAECVRNLCTAVKYCESTIRLSSSWARSSWLPDVLILDEPTNGLDPSGIREMRAFIRFLAEEEGLTVLVSSHLLHEIQLMCDRVAIISKGEIIRDDSVNGLLSSEERLIWRMVPHTLGKSIRKFKFKSSSRNYYLDNGINPAEPGAPSFIRGFVQNSTELFLLLIMIIAVDLVSLSGAWER